MEFAEVVFLLVVLDVLQFLLVEWVFLVVDHLEDVEVDLAQRGVAEMGRILH